MSVEDEGRLRGLDPVHQNALVVLQALLDHQSKGDPRGQNIDPVTSMQSCLIVAAALIEINGAAETTRGFREALDDASEALRRTARKMRADFAETGKHGLELLGATGVWTEAVN